MKKRAGLFITGVVLVALGVAAILWGLGNVRHGRASESWPTTEGIVIMSEIARTTSTSTGKTRKTTTNYRANVEYEYTVGGVDYKRDQISFGQFSTSSRSQAQLVVNRYRVGESVQVHYDPDKPEVSLLEPGVGFMTYLPAAVGGVFILLGVVFFLASRKQGATVPASDTAVR